VPSARRTMPRNCETLPPLHLARSACSVVVPFDVFTLYALPVVLSSAMMLVVSGPGYIMKMLVRPAASVVRSVVAVGVALLPAASRMVPPFSASAVVAV